MIKIPGRGRLKALSGNRDGNVTLLFAMLAVPLLGCIGLAVDYGTASRMKTQLQAMLDDATLAAVAQTSVSGQTMSQVARLHINSELSQATRNATFSISEDDTRGSVTATAELKMNTLFMGLLGTSSTTVNAVSTAVAGAGGPTQVAIAMDTTGSMQGSKLASAQKAASDLVDLLFKKPGSSELNPNVRVGLVPFDRYVNVGLQYRTAPWMSVQADYTPTYSPTDTPVCGASWINYALLAVPVHVPQICDGVQDCSYDDYNDYSKPLGCAPVTWQGCVGSQPDPSDVLVPASAANPVPGVMNIWCSTPLVRLTTDPNQVKAAINNLTAANETYIAPGLLWGWRLLSADPTGPFVDGGPDATTKKRLILMTDGANTHSPQYPYHEGTDVNLANAKLTQVCTNIKAAGIQIYAIAFEVTDPTIKTLLAQCASGPPFYYDAQTIADLSGAFSKIGSEMTQPRLLR